MRIFNNISRKTFIVISSASIATAGFAQIAAAKTYIQDGLAVSGYDPVAYFTQDKPVEGSAEFSLTWADAEWRFLLPKT